MADSTTGSSSSEEIARLMDETSEDVRIVLAEVTKIERATVQQKHRNKSAMSKQIADAIKRRIS